MIEKEAKPNREELRQRGLDFIKYIDEHPDEFQDIEGKTDVSVNHDEFLAEIYAYVKEPSQDELRQRALSVIGIAKDIDGATDISINHDKYLDEAYDYFKGNRVKKGADDD